MFLKVCCLNLISLWTCCFFPKSYAIRFENQLKDFFNKSVWEFIAGEFEFKVKSGLSAIIMLEFQQLQMKGNVV